MIVKSMSRTAPSFHQLLHYISAEGKGAGEPLLHNLRADGWDLAAVNRAFAANAAHAPQRRNGIALYHEVLSLSGADAATPVMLYDLAAHYLTLRAPRCLAYGRVHTDGPNPHIHLVISANLRGRAKKLRLSRARFDAIKRDLERYQRERYPALTHSLVFPAPDRPEPLPERPGEAPGASPVRSRGEREFVCRKRRQGRPEERTKAVLAEMVSGHLTASTSAAAFRRCLVDAGIEPYDRGGRLAGVRYRERKYRLATLGLSEAELDHAERIWDRTPARLSDLADLLAEKTRGLFRGLGYAREMMAVLDRAPARVLSPALSERLGALQRIEQSKWRRDRHRLERVR